MMTNPYPSHGITIPLTNRADFAAYTNGPQIWVTFELLEPKRVVAAILHEQPVRTACRPALGGR
jgi:hypothetical protein